MGCNCGKNINKLPQRIITKPTIKRDSKKLIKVINRGNKTQY